MEVFILLLLIFAIWQAIGRRGSKKPEFNWQEAAACEAELAEQNPQKPIVLPTMEERIDSCYETLAQCQAEWAQYQAEERLNHHPVDDAELIGLLYTPDRMHRANIFKEEQRYLVQYENLRLFSENALYHIYEPGRPCGRWEYDGGESWFDTLEDAEKAAQAVMKWLN